MILNCLKTKEPYVGPKSDCQISPIFLQFWRVLSYIFRLLSPIFLYFWTPKVLDTLRMSSIRGTSVIGRVFCKIEKTFIRPITCIWALAIFLVAITFIFRQLFTS